MNDRRLPLSAAVFAVACVLGLGGMASAAQAEKEDQPGEGVDMAAARDRATRLVVQAARSDDPFIRANAMEAAEHAGRRAVPLLQVGIGDDSRAVRFAALCTLGKLGDRSMEAAARRKLRDPDPSVRCAAIYALHEMGVQVDQTPLAQALLSSDPTKRNNAALLLGLIGEPSAVPMLAQTDRRPMPRASAVADALSRVQVAEAMVRLGDDEALDPIRAGMYSTFDEVRVLSTLMIGRLGDRSMQPALQRLLEQNPVELRLAAAEALGRFGKAQALPAVLAALDFPSPPVRSQAALALGVFDQPQARAALVRLLDDKDPAVRLAAAAAVLGQGGGG